MSKFLVRSCSGAVGVLGLLYLVRKLLNTASDKTVRALHEQMELTIRRARTDGMAVEARSRAGGTVTLLRRER